MENNYRVPTEFIESPEWPVRKLGKPDYTVDIIDMFRKFIKMIEASTPVGNEPIKCHVCGRGEIIPRQKNPDFRHYYICEGLPKVFKERFCEKRLIRYPRDD